MRDERSRRRPAGTASRSNGDGEIDSNDARILADSPAGIDGVSHSWTWSDADADKLVAFIDRCLDANSEEPESVQQFSRSACEEGHDVQ
jgi:hypothetical protein